VNRYFGIARLLPRCVRADGGVAAAATAYDSARVAGFADLTFHDYGQSDHLPLRGVERHPGWDLAEGWPTVWIVEAVATGIPAETSGLAAEIDTESARSVRSSH